MMHAWMLRRGQLLPLGATIGEDKKIVPALLKNRDLVTRAMTCQRKKQPRLRQGLRSCSGRGLLLALQLITL